MFFHCNQKYACQRRHRESLELLEGEVVVHRADSPSRQRWKVEGTGRRAPICHCSFGHMTCHLLAVLVLYSPSQDVVGSGWMSAVCH